MLIDTGRKNNRVLPCLPVFRSGRGPQAERAAGAARRGRRSSGRAEPPAAPGTHRRAEGRREDEQTPPEESAASCASSGRWAGTGCERVPPRSYITHRDELRACARALGSMSREAGWIRSGAGQEQLRRTGGSRGRRPPARLSRLRVPRGSLSAIPPHARSGGLLPSCCTACARSPEANISTPAFLNDSAIITNTNQKGALRSALQGSAHTGAVCSAVYLRGF